MTEHPIHARLHDIRAHVHEYLGEVETSGIELVTLIRLVANQYEMLSQQDLSGAELSGPRWGLLLRLMGEEKRGNRDGLTPTYLSRCQRVTKNTISALLRGLEEQGFIERRLDAADRRHFRICLSESGRALVHNTAPQHILRLNDLVAGLTDEERNTLLLLLAKLHHSLIEHGGETPEWHSPEPAVES